MVQVMRFVDHQHDRLLALAHQVAQFPLAQLALLGDLRFLVGRQVAEQRGDQRAQRDPALLDGDRLRHDDAVLARQQLLQPAQRHRLAGADHAAQCDQVAVIDRLLDVLQQLAVMRGLVVADGARRARQAVELHHFSAHARRPLPVARCARSRK